MLSPCSVRSPAHHKLRDNCNAHSCPSAGACHGPVTVVPDSLQEHTSCGWDYPRAGLKESQRETNEPSEVRAREPTEQEVP